MKNIAGRERKRSDEIGYRRTVFRQAMMDPADQQNTQNTNSDAQHTQRECVRVNGTPYLYATDK